MTTVHAEMVGNKALLSREELERLVEIAQRSEPVELLISDTDLPTQGLMRLAEQGGAFGWLTEEEDLYNADDLKVRYR